MACLKRLVYIFIPVLAVLLMSHNTFALDNTYDPVTCFNDTGTGQVTCTQAPYYTGNTVNVISVSRANNSWEYGQAERTFIWALRVRTTGNYPIAINLSNGYPEQADISTINQFCESTANGTICNVLVTGLIRTSDFNIQLAGQITAYGVNYDIKSVYFTTQVTDGTFSRSIYQYARDIYNYLRNNPSASAQDIADAVNAPEEEAVDNIENQTTDDYEMQSANMSSLFSQFGAFITAVQGASVGDCNIPANLNHLNLGILDMCANPVPDYAQVAVSIIVCMLIAPYLLNIIKRIIGIADKVREV